MINGNFDVFGSVEILFDVVEASNNVTLHILDIITKNETVEVCSTFNLIAQVQSCKVFSLANRIY